MLPTTAEMTTAAAGRDIIRFSPPPFYSATPPCDPEVHDCKWWPYSNSNDFGVNTAMIIIVLLCALICALALNTAIRCFLRSGGRQSPNRLPQTQQEQKPNTGAGAAALLVAPTLIYSAGMKLGRAEADCAICLSEFVEGEGIRVLGNCKHGFHVHCIQQWLSSHSSCPVCRSSCLASSSFPECCPENDNSQQLQMELVPEGAPGHLSDASPSLHVNNV